MNKEKYIQNFFEKTHLPPNVINQDLFHIFRYLHNNDTFFQNKIKNSKMYKKKLFKNVLRIKYSKKQLLSIIHKYFSNDLPQKQCSNLFHNLLLNTMRMKHHDEIIKIQRFVRNYIYSKINQYNNFESENITDPFTLENIQDIPTTNLFSISDKKSRIYKFNAIEFDYYINNIQKINPYTKEELSDQDISYLNLFIKYNNLSKLYKKDFVWESPLQAYTEASQIMEKAGFYNNVKWFLNLSYHDIKNTISLFQVLSMNTVHDFFSSDFDADSYQYQFAKCIIELFTDFNNNFAHCCNFINAIASHSNDFYENVPDWTIGNNNLYDIEFLTLIYYFSIE